MATTAADVALRRQMTVDRLKAGRMGDVSTLRKDIEGIISDEFKPLLKLESLGDIGARDFQTVISRVTRALSARLTEYKLDTLDWLEDLSGAEAHIGAAVFEQISGKEVGELDLEKIWKAVEKAHIPANGLTAAETLQSGSDFTLGSIIRRLRMGQVNGEKPEDVLRAILGTDALQSRDGILNKLENAFRAGSNTTVQHVTSKTDELATAAAAKQRPVSRYQWVSVLDDKTTEICQHRNGMVYKVGDGPLPPAHWNCRSTTITLDSDEAIAVPESKEDWLDAQPAKVRTFLEDGPLSLRDYAVNALAVILDGLVDV